MKQQLARNQGFHFVEVVIIAAIVGVLAFVGLQAYRYFSGNEAAPAAQVTNNRNKLCYIKAGRVECYTDGSFAKAKAPSLWQGLAIASVVSAPDGQQLAIVTGSAPNQEIYIAGSSLQLTRVDMGNYRNPDRVAWLPGQSSIVFGAQDAAANRTIVQYDIKTHNVTPLTIVSTQASMPMIADDKIVYLRANGGWRWHAMTLEGKDDGDLGVGEGVVSAVNAAKLYVVTNDRRLLEVKIATGGQRVIASQMPFTTPGYAAILHDGRMVAAYGKDANGQATHLGLVDLRTGQVVSLANKGASAPFETGLIKL